MSHFNRVRKGMVWLSGAALLAGATLSLARNESRGQSPAADGMRTVTGKVKDFTTAPRGETDGAVLDDGTVIHWPPHLEDNFKGILERGDRIRVTGWMETGRRGDTHLEVRTVTNLRTKASRSNDNDAPPPPPRGARRGGAERAAADRPADRDQHVRDLERQIEQLRRENERLRRER